MSRRDSPVVLRGAWPSRFVVGALGLTSFTFGLQEAIWWAAGSPADWWVALIFGGIPALIGASLMWQAIRSRVELLSDRVVVHQIGWGRREIIPREAIAEVRSSALGQGPIPTQKPVLDCRRAEVPGFEHPHAIHLDPLLSWSVSKRCEAVERRVDAIQQWLWADPA